jgi:hypothetical protein
MTSEELRQQPADVSAETLLDKDGKYLLGDYRDFLLRQVRRYAPWATMTEKQQQELIDASTAAAVTFIHRAVAIVAANGKPAMRAVLAQITIKDGIEAKVKVSKYDPMRHDLVDAQGSTLLISIVDAAAFSETRGDVKPDPDQPPLPIDDDAGPDDDSGPSAKRSDSPKPRKGRRPPPVDDGGTDDDPDDNDDD